MRKYFLDANYMLGTYWAGQNFFLFFHNILQKNSNKLFCQANISTDSYLPTVHRTFCLNSLQLFLSLWGTWRNLWSPHYSSPHPSCPWRLVLACTAGGSAQMLGLSPLCLVADWGSWPYGLSSEATARWLKQLKNLGNRRIWSTGLSDQENRMKRYGCREILTE